MKNNDITKQMYQINPINNVDVKFIGKSNTPLIVIDNFSSNPQLLVNNFKNNAVLKEAQGAENFYPGKHANVSNHYGNELYTSLKPLIKDYFKLPVAYLERIFCDYSVISKSESELTKYQSIPHYDSYGKGHLAILHYLCEPPFQGTGFYRHNKTGIEIMTRENSKVYWPIVEKELTDPEFTTGYIQGECNNYTLIEKVDAKFNRLVIYKSQSLHSSIILPDNIQAREGLGRLTLRTFLFY